MVVRRIVLAALLAARIVAGQTGFDALAKRASTAREQNQDEEARRLYQEALKFKPGWSEGWWYLGSLYYDADQYRAGVDAFRHLTALEPKMAVAWAMLGLCEFETHDYDRALTHLERGDQLGLAASDSIFNVARYHLALLLTRSEHYDAAMAIITPYAIHESAGPKWVEAMGIAALHKPVLPSELPTNEREVVMGVGQAICEAAGRHFKEAIAQLKSLTEQYPNQPQIHYYYGQLLLTNEPDEALKALKQELEISPGHPEALVSIASEYLKRGDYKTALPYAEQAVASAPKYFAAHAVLGRALAEGDFDVQRGAKELELAVRMDPESPQPHFALANAYAKAGRKEDAARERAEFLRLRAQNEAPPPRQEQ